jgi:hypothetical protein
MTQYRFSFGNIIGSLIILALSLGVLAFAWSLVEEELVFLANSKFAEGEVVDQVFIKGSGKGPKSHRSYGAHYPIVRYFTDNGEEFQVQGRIGSENTQTLYDGIKSGANVKAQGSKIRVAYNKDNPADARTLGFDEQYLYPLIFSCIGLMLLFFSVLVFRDAWKKS